MPGHGTDRRTSGSYTVTSTSIKKAPKRCFYDGFVDRTYLTRLKPPVQLICSRMAKVICRKPNASSSRARFKDPASTTTSPLPFKDDVRRAFACALSEASSTVAGASPANVEAKFVLKA